MIRTRDKKRAPALIALLGAILLLVPATDANEVTTLSLEQAIARAKESDEQILQMAEAITAAQSNVMAANAGRLPSVDLAGTWTHNLKKPAFFLPADLAAGFGGATSVEMGGDWALQGAATVTLNLYTSGRLSSARALAEQGVEATRWQEALVRDAVVFGVTQAYYNVLLADEQVTIAEQALGLARENHRITRAAHDEGRASRFDLLRAEVELTNRESPQVQARNARRQAELALLRACGLAPDTALQLTTALGHVEGPADEETLLARMRTGSPELRMLEHAARAAEWSVSLAKAGRGPMVQLQGQYALQGEWNDDIIPGSDEAVSSASAAIGFSWPVFDGFAAKADISGREAELRSAKLDYDRTLNDRELGVRQARTQLENALLALEGRREGVTLAEEAHRLAAIRKENGLATPLELLDAELALTEARVQLAGSLHACNIADAALKLAVGGNEEN